jgi:uncharacterized membrane protein YfcA
VIAEFTFYALVGFVAQLVDGTIGMAYGVVSTTALLSAGVSPLTATANIHFAELVTGGASGVFHIRRQHVSWALVRRLVLAGAPGAAAGAWVIVTVTPNAVTTVRRGVAVYLLMLGLWLCWRSARQRTPHPREPRASALGFFGGLFDAAGGGWGPIVTANLMTSSIAPRVVVGTSIVAEFVVTATHVLVFAGPGGLRPEVATAGLLAGGLAAAPIAARVAGQLPPRLVVGLVGVGVVVAAALLIAR